MDVSLELRRQMVDQLLRLNGTQSLEDRLRILQRMNANIAHRIPESSAARTHLNDIVERCSNVPGAIQSFIESVAEDELHNRAFPAVVTLAVLVVAVAAARAELSESTFESTLRSGLPMSVKTDRSLNTLADKLTALWNSENSPEPPIYAYLDWLGEQLPTAKIELVDLKVWTKRWLELSPAIGLSSPGTIPESHPPIQTQPDTPSTSAAETSSVLHTSKTIEHNTPGTKSTKDGDYAFYRIFLILIVTATIYVNITQPTNTVLRNISLIGVAVLAIWGIGKDLSSGFKFFGAMVRILRELTIGVVASLIVYVWTTPNGWSQIFPFDFDEAGKPFTELTQVTQPNNGDLTLAPVSQDDVSDQDAAVQTVLQYQAYLNDRNYEGAYNLLSEYFRRDLCRTRSVCDYASMAQIYRETAPIIDIPLDEIWDLRDGLTDNQGKRIVFNARTYSEENGKRTNRGSYRYCVLLSDGNWYVHGISVDLENPFCG